MRQVQSDQIKYLPWHVSKPMSVKSSLLLCAAHLARSSSSILLRIAVL
eukprot:SAG31_NODE_31223_length_370_cov_1.557196_1_plen_47_part_01